MKTATKFFLFSLIFGVCFSLEFEYELNSVKKSLDDFLLDSNAKLSMPNRLLPNTHLESRKWADKQDSTPIWLKMANQALFLEYDKHKNHKKLLIKLELANMLPHLQNMTNTCLRNPWFDEDVCDFEHLDKNIKLMCLVENVAEAINPIKTKSDQTYQLFCWLIHSITYIEQCQLNLIVDEENCSLQRIELFLNLIHRKLSSFIKNDPVYLRGDFEAFFKFYIDLVRERSMQIIVEILLLFEKYHSNFGQLQLKFTLEKLMNRLLNDFVRKQLASDLEYKLGDTQSKSQLELHIIDKKIRSLVKFSLEMILKHLVNLIKRVNY